MFGDKTHSIPEYGGRPRQIARESTIRITMSVRRFMS